MKRTRATARMTLLVALFVSTWAGAAQDEDDAVYQWTDAGGVVRYTSDPGRVPRSERDTLLRLEPGMPATRPSERAAPTGTIPSMLGASIPEAATSAPGKPSLTTTAPTPAPPPKSDAESPIGQPIPMPGAAGSAPAREAPAATPATDPNPDSDSGGLNEPNASALPAWWGAPDRHELGTNPATDLVDDSIFVLAEAETDLDSRIRMLEETVARDEKRLEDMISASNGEAVSDLQNSPELLEIARRLPGLQAELGELYRERAARQGP